MTIFDGIFLGVVQGLTEFLPISSSGHLVLFSRFLGVETQSLLFEITVHGGTLVAVIVMFWDDLVELVASFLKLVKNPGQIKNLLETDPGCRLLRSVFLATLPVVVVALALKDQIEQLFHNATLVGFMLIITGFILFASDRLEKKGKDLNKLSVSDALLIGGGQAIAIMPGISRSGTTIGLGLTRGLSRESAARFSFLMSIPAILGALVFSVRDLAQATILLSPTVLIAGFLASAVTGYFAIRLLLILVRRGKLIWFSYYTWAAGALVIISNWI